MKYLLYILILLLAISCIGKYRGEFKIGTCVEEQNKMYVSGPRRPASIYKVHNATSREFIVSVWFNRSWLYQGKKPDYYFDDGKNFSYESIHCPDVPKRERAGIAERLKSFQLK